MGRYMREYDQPSVLIHRRLQGIHPCNPTHSSGLHTYTSYTHIYLGTEGEGVQGRLGKTLNFCIPTYISEWILQTVFLCFALPCYTHQYFQLKPSIIFSALMYGLQNVHCTYSFKRFIRHQHNKLKDTLLQCPAGASVVNEPKTKCTSQQQQSVGTAEDSLNARSVDFACPIIITSVHALRLPIRSLSHLPSFKNPMHCNDFFWLVANFFL